LEWYLKEVVSLLFGDAELEARRDGQKYMHEWHHILLLLQSIHDGHYWEPRLIVVSYYDRKNFFVKFNKFVSPIAPDDCNQQRSFNLIFLRNFDFFFFSRPPHFDIIFKLYQGSLFDIESLGLIVNNFHHAHAET